MVTKGMEMILPLSFGVKFMNDTWYSGTRLSGETTDGVFS